MNTRIAVLFSSFAALASCQTDVSSDATEPDSDATPLFVSPDPPPTVQEYLKEHELSPGNWREADGSRICEGYMTRFEDEDYCASQIPEDWIPFQFDGETYYSQPLTDQSDPP